MRKRDTIKEANPEMTEKIEDKSRKLNSSMEYDDQHGNEDNKET